ncbi:tetratricopeptide repeat protein [Bernardetia sp. OM2101]|uniref:tetratricopeptide repeat protein n=1 Tax=Bernardetia sp. OM2101 TaxID=3344876 RepID=UPI0035CED1E6
MARSKELNISISEDASEKIKIIITEDPTAHYKLTDKLHKDLDTANRNLLKGKITPYQLKVLINKYPHVPTFYNYLSVAYEDNNQFDKVLPVIKTLIKKFPTYFHAQLNLISFYLKTENKEALDAYFENVDSIKDVAPKKENFHVDEFMGFYSAFVEYLETKRDRKKMTRIFDMLDNVAPHFPTIKAELPNLKILLQRVDIMLAAEEKAKQENAPIIYLKEDKEK